MKLEHRFWKKVIISDGCWEWVGYRNNHGYGRIWVNGKMKGAHRVSWELHFGEIPEGLFVCHHCDNPACVNFNHLFLGTQKDNMADRDKKGRAFSGNQKGESNGNSKINEDQVFEIRRLYKTGLYSQRELGNKFGVNPGHICNIINKKRWSCLEEKCF